MIEFRNDDEGYADWLAAHPDGHVINIARSYSPADARVHRASCRWITGPVSRGVGLTDHYVKGCAGDLNQLAQWPTRQVREQILPCRTCHDTTVAAPASLSVPARQASSSALSEGRWDVQGPTGGNGVVKAWSDDYIRFERRPPWQEGLRTEIRNRCGQFEQSSEQVLHATFAGDKRVNADIENLVLYNIGSFKAAGRNGIRFEHGASVPPAPDATDYPYGYRYALSDRSDTFTDWEPVRTLATFDWISLKGFDGDKKQAKAWLAVSRALARGEIEVLESAAPATPFAVRVQLRPPQGRRPVWGNLVKEVFDGVICAFQAHLDSEGLDEVVQRLGTYLPAGLGEIRRLLLDQNCAVLGAVPSLVSPYRAGVKWNPADHLCIAGELLAAEPDGSTNSHWAIRGDLIELSRRAD